MAKVAVCDTNQVFRLRRDVRARTKKQTNMQAARATREKKEMPGRTGWTCLTCSLRGAKTGGEAGCWSVPLEAFVRHDIGLGAHMFMSNNKILRKLMASVEF